MKLRESSHHIKMDRYRAVHAGFTLIEVMITLVIVAVLMMVAVPMYERSVQKSRRTDGMRDLMELASRQERFYAQNSQYTDDIADLDFDQGDRSKANYTLTTAACPGGTINTCYQLSAAPIVGSPQEDDACGTLTVDSKGQRKAAKEDCW